MAWTATITKVRHAISTVEVTVTITDGADTYDFGYNFLPETTPAEALAIMRADRARYVAVVTAAKAAKSWIGTVIA